MTPMSQPTENSSALVPTSPPDQLPQPCGPLTSARRTGKVARLPKSVRDQLNTMLEDGVPYLQIIERLGPDGEGLTETNLSNWKSGGYQDWLRTRQLTDAIQRKYELARDIVARTANGNEAGRAVLQAMAINLCEFLTETDPMVLRESLLSDADKFTRFVNAMVRLAEGGIKCEVHGFSVEDRSAQAHGPKADHEPGISDQALQKAEKKLKLL